MTVQAAQNSAGIQTLLDVRIGCCLLGYNCGDIVRGLEVGY